MQEAGRDARPGQLAGRPDTPPGRVRAAVMHDSGTVRGRGALQQCCGQGMRLAACRARGHAALRAAPDPAAVAAVAGEHVVPGLAAPVTDNDDSSQLFDLAYVVLGGTSVEAKCVERCAGMHERF